MSNSIRRSVYKRTSLFAGGLLLVLYILFPNFVSSIAYRIIAPLWVAADRIINTTNSDELVETLKQENELLKKKISISETSRTAEGLLANVLYRPPRTRYDIVAIDKGSNDGALLNQIVYTEASFPAGYITAVWKDRAEVSLWSTPGVDLDYAVRDFVGKGISVGGATIKMQVPKDVDLEAGDVVKFRELSIGTVSYIDAPIDGIWNNVFISILVSPFKISKVIISTDEI